MNGAKATRAALLICPAYFGYENEIVAEFERQGYATTFVDERPTNSALGRAVMRFRRELVGRRISTYYRAWRASLSGRRFDVVVVVKAEIVPRWFLEWLRSENPDATFVLYLWDSIRYNANCLDVLDLFDRRLSFDREDVARRPELEYSPLFYTSEFAPVNDSLARNPRLYSMSFIGTLRPGRYALVRSMFANRPRTFGLLFVQARWYFFAVKYLTRQHPGITWRDVTFTPVSRQTTAEVFRNSHAVLDMPARGQNGSTIRSLEVLASGALLVTTNETIVHEPFFDPERVIVVPDGFGAEDVDAIWARLDSTIPPSGSPRGFEAFSLSSWVRNIVSTTPTR